MKQSLRHEPHYDCFVARHRLRDTIHGVAWGHEASGDACYCKPHKSDFSYTYVFSSPPSKNNNRLLGALARHVGLFFRTHQARQFLTNHRTQLRHKVLTFNRAVSGDDYETLAKQVEEAVRRL